MLFFFVQFIIHNNILLWMLKQSTQNGERETYSTENDIDFMKIFMIHIYCTYILTVFVTILVLIHLHVVCCLFVIVCILQEIICECFHVPFCFFSGEHVHFWMQIIYKWLFCNLKFLFISQNFKWWTHSRAVIHFNKLFGSIIG